MPVNLLDFDAEGLTAWFAQQGEKPFRARQVLRWMHHFGESDFNAMTDIAKSLREKLLATATVSSAPTISDKLSDDGTRKFLFDVGNRNAVETVFIPEDDRGTLCVSSQAGCALECAFCSTGRQGFNRNLSTAEIIGQLWQANRALKQDLEPGKSAERIISNVVLMGMGEPLLNFDNVVRAMSLMRDDNGFGLANKRVTLSTAGLVPMIDKLSEASDVSLAVSLHAPTDELRDTLVPLNKKYPIEQLMDACVRYALRKPRTSITFEYTMMKGINDQPEHARGLVKLMRKIDAQVQRANSAKVNLIPFNPFT